MPGSTRRLTLLYFAGVRERLGVDREEIDVPLEIADVRGLSAWLETARPRLHGMLAQCRFAVGEEFRSPGHRLEAGDVVAIIPPVSGG